MNYCFGVKDKLSCKGVNKKYNEINKEKYLNVRLSKQNSAGVNQGFCVLTTPCTPIHKCTVRFHIFIPNVVLEDGVSTLPLDI